MVPNAASRPHRHPHAPLLGPSLCRLQEDADLRRSPDADAPPAFRAAWRQVALARARRARHELLSAIAAGPPPGQVEPAGEQAAELILIAKEAAFQKVTLWAWLEGCWQEQAWLSLHEAEAQIIELLGDDELIARADEVLDKARKRLGDRDPAVHRVGLLLGQPQVPVGPLRPRVVALARAAFDAADDRYAQSRGYRNRLIRLTIMALAGVTLGLAAGILGRLDFGMQAFKGHGAKTVGLIMLFGSVGALASSIPPLAKTNGSRNPFALPLFQLLLKLALGPLFALVGVLILQADLITGLRPAVDLRTLLVWATLFGAAQQSVTRFIDQRVAGILADGPRPNAPSADAPSRPPRGESRRSAAR